MRGANLYAVFSTRGVVTLPALGTTIASTVVDEVNAIDDVVVDATNLYWNRRGTAVFGRAHADGTNAAKNFTTRAAGLTSITALAFDADYIYWSTADGEVSRAAKADASPPQLVTRILGPLLSVHGFAVDEAYVYVAMSASILVGNDVFDLYRASKCGGPPRLLASDRIAIAGGILSAGAYLYWGHESSVARIAK